MSPLDADSREELLARLRVLEQENELLAERAEDITLLGLVAEQMQTQAEPRELVTSVLERVCVLKALPYGAHLARKDQALHPLAVYHARRAELVPEDTFRLRLPERWPLASSVVVAADGFGHRFEELRFAGPSFAPTALALVPLPCPEARDACLLFADDGRSAAELTQLLPLLERVADLTRARLDNLSLIELLQGLNLSLDQKVVERTRELQLSQARYRTLFDHVPDGVLLVKADEGGFGRIEDANETAAAMHGYSLDELKTLDLEALSTPEEGQRLESFEARVWRLKPGETVREELTHRRRDGSTFPVEAIGTLITLHDRQYILGFCRDITERKQAEQALLMTQRSESIGVLAGGIAHDFNNLLTAIMGQTDMALDQLDPHAPGRENLEKSLRASEKAAILTKQMLAYSGRGQFTIQPVPINHLIQENLRFLEAAMPKQVRFVLDLEDGLPTVTADPGQLQQVVMNLVINGAEAIGEAPGTLTIRTRALRPGPDGFGPWPLGAQDLAEGDYVGLEVTDTGCGMPRDVLARVFDPFYTTKPKGHGLGLSAVQGILRGHRGGLGVESKVGAGTTFRILLPAGGLDEAMAAPAEAGAAADEGRAVLVVDDEEYLLEVVSDSLAATGHSCLLARNGEEGLELFRLHGGEVDLVLLDLSMPGIGGVETFKRLRALDPGLPIILSSGYAREEAMAQLGELTADGFLQKPYVARDLARIIAAVPLRKGHRSRLE